MITKAHISANYGHIFNIASQSLTLMLECFESFDAKAFLFAQFLSQTRSSLALALLSATRRHETQTYMILRQALESAILAAYGLNKPDFNEHGSIGNDRLITLNNNVKNSAYNWIQMEFPIHSDKIKKIKNQINTYSAHSNFLNSSSTFEDTEHGFYNHFFDKENTFIITVQIWLTADTILGLLMFFSDVIKKYPFVSFINEFDHRGNKLLAEIRDFHSSMKTDLNKRKQQ